MEVLTVLAALGFAIYLFVKILRWLGRLLFGSSKAAAKPKSQKGPAGTRVAADVLTDLPRRLSIKCEARGEVSAREIDLERLSAKSGLIYLKGYCYLSDDDRTFRADRIIYLNRYAPFHLSAAGPRFRRRR